MRKDFIIKPEKSRKKNRESYLQYADIFTELAITCFEWKNLPDTVDPRYLELALFESGKCLFFKDETLGYLALRSANAGRMSIYNVPELRHVVTPSGYQAKRDITNSVIIYNNYMRLPSYPTMLTYAERVGKLDRIIDVNTNAQKTPYIVKCSEKQRLTAQNALDRVDRGDPYVMVTEDYNEDTLGVFNTVAPYVADKLYTLKTQIYNEYLTYLGVPNNNVTKKAQLISDEVDRQQGGTLANRCSRLEARRNACREINRMFPDLNLWCDFRDNMISDIEEDVEDNNEEGEEQNAENS